MNLGLQTTGEVIKWTLKSYTMMMDILERLVSQPSKLNIDQGQEMAENRGWITCLKGRKVC